MNRGILQLPTFILGLLCGLAQFAVAAQPVVSNVSVSQRPGTKLVDIYYNLADASGHACTVWINVSGDGGSTWNIPGSSVSGNVGPGVNPGSGKHIVWDAGKDWSGHLVPNCKIRVFANDGTTPIPPAGMVYIPGGSFQMGDNLDGMSDAPTRTVFVDAYFIDQTEVTGDRWLAVKNWADANGYSLGSASFKGGNHPVHTLTWYTAVKWCNARSEKEGLTPVYYTDAAQTTVYRTGDLNLSNVNVKASANGYRLPTEAEWEKAARGGLQGKRFPWGDTITHSQANYNSSTYYFYDVSTTRGYHPTYSSGSQPYTSPAGSFAPNGYGLFDMAGNVREWCWDWYSSTYFAIENPKGPTSGSSRLLRGGSWDYYATRARVADRYGLTPSYSNYYPGFRCVRGL